MKKDMSLSPSRIAAGILLDAIAIYAIGNPAWFHYFSAAVPLNAAEALAAFQGMCIGGFWFGAMVTGTAWYNADLKNADLKKRYLGLLVDFDNLRRRMRKMSDELVRLLEERVRQREATIAQLQKQLAEVGLSLAEEREQSAGELTRRAAEITALRTELAKRASAQALPQYFQMLTHEKVDRAFYVRFHPDHGESEAEKRQRDEMLKRWRQIVDFVQANCRNGNGKH